MSRSRSTLTSLIILGMLFILTSCSSISHIFTGPDFIVVETEQGDTLASLAEKYLDDSSDAWVIAEFNGIDTIKPGLKILIPMIPYKKGGLEVNGYQTVPVLVYHSFSIRKSGKMIITKTAFNSQMRYLKEHGYTVITMEEFMDFLNHKSGIPRKSVVLTLDDGWAGTYDIAYPILKKYGYTATLFIYTEFIGKEKALTWDQLKELRNNGFDVQCQTKTHRNLAEMRKGESISDYRESLVRELKDSKEVIEDMLSCEVKYLAYPYGATNGVVVAMAEKYGYSAGFTVNRGGNPSFINNYMVNRSVIYGDYRLKDFRRNLTIFRKSDLK